MLDGSWRLTFRLSSRRSTTRLSFVADSVPVNRTSAVVQNPFRELSSFAGLGQPGQDSHLLDQRTLTAHVAAYSSTRRSGTPPLPGMEATYKLDLSNVYFFAFNNTWK